MKRASSGPARPIIDEKAIILHNAHLNPLVNVAKNLVY
jgi:hypothetical protein